MSKTMKKTEGKKQVTITLSTGNVKIVCFTIQARVSFMTKNRLGLLDSPSQLTVAQQSSSLVFEGVKNPNERESNAGMTKRGFFLKKIQLNQTFSIFHTFISTVNECCLSPNL